MGIHLVAQQFELGEARQGAGLEQVAALADIVDEELDQHEEGGQHQQGEPGGLPEGAGDGDLDGGALFIPDPVVVGGLDAEGIGAGIEIGIGHKAAAGDIVPLGFKAFHDVGVLVLFAEGVIESGEFKGKDGVAPGEVDSAGTADLLFEQPVRAVDLDRPVEKGETGDHNRGDESVFADGAGVKGGGPVDAPEKELAVAGSEGGAVVELVALEAVFLVEALCPAGFGVEAAEAVAGAQPEAAVFILEDAVDDIAGQAVPGGKGGDGFGRGIEAEEAGPDRADPDHPGAVLEEGAHLDFPVAVVEPDDAKAVAGGIEAADAGAAAADPDPSRTVAEEAEDVAEALIVPGGEDMGKAAGAEVKAVEAAAVGADPEIARFLLQEGEDVVIGERGGVAGPVGVAAEAAAGGAGEVIETTVEGADPEAALAVLEQGLDVVDAEAGGIAGFVGIVSKEAAAAVEAVQSSGFGAEPEVAGAVLHDRIDLLGVEAAAAGGVGAVVDEGDVGGVEKADAAAGADPEVALAVLEDGLHRILHQAVGIVGIVGVAGDHAAFAFEAVEAAAVADPEGAVAVVEDGAESGALGVLRARVDGAEASGRALHAVEAAPGGADPEAALAVLIDGVDLVVAEGMGVAPAVAVGGESA